MGVVNVIVNQNNTKIISVRDKGMKFWHMEALIQSIAGEEKQERADLYTYACGYMMSTLQLRMYNYMQSLLYCRRDSLMNTHLSYFILCQWSVLLKEVI